MSGVVNVGVVNVAQSLLEYMLREKMRVSGGDLFTSFLGLIAEKQCAVSPIDDLPEV